MASLYGKHWLDMWGDIPVDDIKREWCSGLGKFHLKTIGAALTYCADKVQFPPTLPEFRQICESCSPKEVVKALPRKFTAEELAVNRERISSAAENLVVKQERDMRNWAKAILKRVDQGDKTVPEIAKKFAREALRV